MRKTALIMAGGRGERFWPKSRKNMPKQFLSLTDDGKTLIQQAVERILPLVGLEDIFVATNRDYRDLVRQQLPGLPEENILCEPVGRNTAPCIGLGAVHIMKKYGDAVMMVFPSDHLIQYAGMFRAALKRAAEVAESGANLVTMGITPSYPETGYGYIKFCAEEPQRGAFRVEHFVEKPDLEKAREYLATERYLWNSGMFVWKCSTLMDNMRRYLPELFEGLARVGASLGTAGAEQTLEREFAAFPSISVDYGILEKAENIYTLPGTFGWDDVGSWLALERLRHADEFGNVFSGDLVAIDVRSSIVQGGDKLLALIGVENLIVVDSPDATLICAKSAAQDIKKCLQQLKICGKTEYL